MTRTPRSWAAILRLEAGRSRYSQDIADLIGDLATRSDEFKTRWATHHVRAHRRGTKRLRHSVVGDLTLHYEALEIPDSGGLTVFGYTAERGSPSDDALRLLGSWAASAPGGAAHAPQEDVGVADVGTGPPAS